MTRILIGIAVVVLTLGIVAVVAAQNTRDYSATHDRIEISLQQHISSGYLEVGVRHRGQQRFQFAPVNISPDSPSNGEWRFAYSSRWVEKPWKTLTRDSVCLAVQGAADAVSEQRPEVTNRFADSQLQEAEVDLNRAVEHMAHICDGVPGWRR